MQYSLPQISRFALAVAVLSSSISVTLAQDENAKPIAGPVKQPDQTKDPTAAETDTKSAPSDTTDSTAASKASEKSKTGTIRFSFDRAPWKQVIQTLAESADLALHIGDLPTGSFTYSDAKAFTYQEAISRVNLFLLPEGFTMVRSGKLLSVINLTEARSLKQLDALAKMVTIAQLDDLQEHEVVKCIFPLGELDAEDAVEELAALNLMVAPAVFNKTKRIMITETVAKLKSAKAILDAFKPDTLDNGTVVKNFALKHVDAEDILVVVRPHMGLATGEMIGIDVSLSADLQGKNIFVTGVEDKVKLIENLVQSLDVPQKSLTASGDAKLRSHPVTGRNVETIYNVLLTLLADKEVRLSMDEEAGNIVALASAETQTEIEQTIAQLQASEADFEVIPLKTVDPYFAVSLIEGMLDLPDAFTDPDDIEAGFPKIDADPGNMRLYVRGKKHQIEQIKKIVAGLEANATSENGETIRIVPLKGKQALSILETAGRFWRGDNPIILYPTSNEIETKSTERVLAETSRKQKFDQLFKEESPEPQERTLSKNKDSDAPPIHCQLTPRGLLLQSEDSKALDEFEQHLRTITGPIDSTPSPPVVFYLKYAKPDNALRMLAELLDGGESAKEGEAGSLVNSYASSSSLTYLGSIVSSRSGTTTMMAGTITVVADTRLNRLIAQGTAGDIERIEAYLKIVDKDSSITAIETYGKSQVIELVHAKAIVVAEILREVYAGRMINARSATAAKPQSGQPNAAQSRARVEPPKSSSQSKQSDSKKNTAQKSAASQATKNLEPQLTIAVHEVSNSLIVTAPDQLFGEVERLAKVIDARSAQTVRVIKTENALRQAEIIQKLFGDRIRTSDPQGSAGGSTPSARAPSIFSTTRPKR